MSPSVTLVSACLGGLPCRYDARAKPEPAIVEAVRAGHAIPACAEQLGGLPTPRPAAEIVGGDGQQVLDGSARIVTAEGEDVTDAFVRGAELVAEIASQHGVAEAVLQARSPSCGAGTIYDGSHSGTLTSGDGVLAALLKRNGVPIRVIRGYSEAPRVLHTRCDV